MIRSAGAISLALFLTSSLGSAEENATLPALACLTRPCRRRRIPSGSAPLPSRRGPSRSRRLAPVGPGKPWTVSRWAKSGFRC